MCLLSVLIMDHKTTLVFLFLVTSLRIRNRTLDVRAAAHRTYAGRQCRSSDGIDMVGL